ncbi:MAG: hypothetical protein M4579_004894 [Chaenotheca gracillima]|nr:MAG: hypothetical protein M4579_004894 [Chaenotheca gracillima]
MNAVQHEGGELGEEIDRPRNAITLTLDIHQRFGQLEIYFEPTAAWSTKRQEYDVKKHGEYFLFVPVRRVFLEHGMKEIPSRRLLELHAACARVCHASGATEYIERINQDMKEGQVRADGSTDLGTLIMAGLVDKSGTLVP